MKRKPQKNWTDVETFSLLESKDIGIPCPVIAKRLGRSLNSVYRRIEDLKAAHIPSEHDGSMPYGWWRDGLAKRKSDG